jgi:histidyl-tRNA synthetase
VLSLLLNFKGKTSGFLENLKTLPRISPELKGEIDNFAEVSNLLDAAGCNYRIDIASVRDFEYYSGLCFKFLLNDEKIASGGRYDDLIPIFGDGNTPACGFAIYIDPLINLIQFQQQQTPDKGVAIAVGQMTPAGARSAFQLASSLRKAGYVAEFVTSNRKLKWQWLVTVQDQHPLFNVADQLRNQKVDATSADAVLGIIGGSA